MARATGRPRKTVEDYLALPDDVRAELIGGELYVTPAPTPVHQQVGSRIRDRLEAWCRRSRAGAAFVAPIDVHLPSGDVVQPDVVLVLAANRGIVQDAIRGVPDLVVEVVSPPHAERDRIVKRDVYERSGVREHWVADPSSRSIEVLRREEGVLRPAGYFEEDEVLTTASLPGFDLRLDEVYAPLF